MGGVRAMGGATPVLNSPTSEWPRRRDLCPQLARSKPLPDDRTALRFLGWEGLPQPAPHLFEALREAVARLGLSCQVNVKSWLLVTQQPAEGAPPGDASRAAEMVAEAWVAGGRDGVSSVQLGTYITVIKALHGFNGRF